MTGNAQIDAEEYERVYKPGITYWKPNTPRVIIGAWAISPSRSDSAGVWIERAFGDCAGEGGDFDAAEFERVIAAFYEQNF